MLKPAICYKAEIEAAMAEYFYTDDMRYYMCCNDSYVLDIRDEGKEGHYQYAVIGEKGNLIGYIGYMIDYYSSGAYSIGAFSFDRGNPVMGKELFTLIERLISQLHRVEFRAVEGNPAIRGYDRFLERHKEIGKKIILKDVFKDTSGKYHDTYIYEFINPGEEGL